MPSPEQFYQPHPLEAAPTDYGEQAAQPSTSPHMEQVVTQLAAAHGVDLSQPGAQFTLDRPDQNQRWMITSLDGDRVSVTRFQVDEGNLLSPDIDMVFAVTEFGWEPREIVHAQRPWDEFAQTAQEQDLMVFNEQGNLRYEVFTEVWAAKLEQGGGLDQGQEEKPANHEESSKTEIDLSEQSNSWVIGKPDFNWREELSENGQWLYELLIGEQGRTDLLPLYADEDNYDLPAALNELRIHDLIDESNSKIVKIIKRRL